MTEPRWVFGVQPLPVMVEVASALRDVTDAALALERASPELEELVHTLRDAHARLAAQAPPDLRPRVGDDPSDDRRVYVDHGYDIGSFNPCFPRYTLEVDDDGARGTVEFPLSYEGPPGIVHGGFLAVFFDAMLQEYNCMLGLTGSTSELSIRYRRPTPLLRPLTYRAERIVDDRRITAHAELFRGDDLLCEAHLLAANGDRAALPAVSARRS